MGDPYHQYYYRQAHGAGLPVFQGIPIQRGHGLGNVLNAGFRMLLPTIKAAGKFALKEGLGNVVTDVIKGAPLKKAVKNRTLQTGAKLLNRALAQVGMVGPRKARGRGRRRRQRQGVGAARKGKKKAGAKRRVQSGRGRLGVRKRRRRRVGGRRGGRTRVAVGAGDIFS